MGFSATRRIASIRAASRVGALARARADLDVETATAWVLIAVSGLVAVEYGVLHPIRAELERWREAARPWGVKR